MSEEKELLRLGLKYASWLDEEIGGINQELDQYIKRANEYLAKILDEPGESISIIEQLNKQTRSETIIRLLIAEILLDFAMSIAPSGTQEKLEIAEFCCDYFSKRIKEQE